MSYPPRRVVVTGMGCITALGRTSPETFSALMAGKCARGDISCFATEDCRTRHGAQVDLSEPWNGISARRWEALPRASRLALIAVGEALAHADLLNDRGRCKMSRLEIAASSTAGGMPCGETFLRERLPSKDGAPRTEQGTGDIRNLTHYQPQSQIADIHRHFGFGGPFFIVANACASGANAIGHAWQLIRRGDADIILAGGFEALARLVFTGFDSLQSLSPDLCRPFDTARNGLM
ncbi:beta-ketoacyl-[acyl-carrier-protein] synthase family protein, partial [Verrucomicrobia bacterium LW23]